MAANPLCIRILTDESSSILRACPSLQLDKVTADAAEFKAGFDKAVYDNAEMKAGYDKATYDAAELKAGYDKLTADAAEFKAGFDKAVHDNAEQKAQVWDRTGTRLLFRASVLLEACCLHPGSYSHLLEFGTRTFWGRRISRWLPTPFAFAY